ncbi:MAG: nicotinamide-nucleotide amidohydrolase family protein [Gammaproteobacteria bacterium]|nr:nicotinamide-nucleotide amidohydrolase family protein [Gammaproteobacteria bacterium]
MLKIQLSDAILALSKLLIVKNYKMATAESCTGGWVAKAATDLAGSSSWFDRGLVTYSNQSKMDILGVSAATLEAYGAVSQQTVVEMVAGLLRSNSVSIGVAISGIAGPDGGTIEKPLGTVWLAWQSKSSEVFSKCYLFEGNREDIRLQAALKAVTGMIDLLESDQ